jgi:hypothetical protein
MTGGGGASQFLQPVHHRLKNGAKHDIGIGIGAGDAVFDARFSSVDAGMRSATERLFSAHTARVGA